MPITLTGLASGLDTESIISQLMAIEQNKVTAVQMRQVTVQQHKTDLRRSRASSTPSRRPPPRSATPRVEGDADHDVLGPDQGRRHRARRRRHRRPLDPGRQARVLGPARLHLHGRRHRGHDRRSPTRRPRSTTVARSTSRPTRPRRRRDADQRQRERPGLRGRRQGRRDDERIVLSARKTGQNSNFTVDTSRSAPAARSTRTAPTRARARRSTRRTRSTASAAPRTPQSNVIENAIPGVRLTLKGITREPGVGHHDLAGRRHRTRSPRRSQRSSTPTTPSSRPRAPSSPRRRSRTPTTTSGPAEGPAVRRLRHDRRCCARSRAQMTQTLSGLGLTGLADLGIGVPKSTGGATTQDAKDGKLTFDTDQAQRGRSPPTTRRSATCSPAWAPPRASRRCCRTTSARRPARNGMITGRMNSDDDRS